jgi:hypothetical protein
MNSSNPIGGYFELELPSGQRMHDDALQLNSGRNCFMYLLQAVGPKHVYLPRFICDAMVEPLERAHVSYEFYDVNDRLELSKPIEVADDELLVYVNYFGLKDAYSRQLAEQYGQRLVLDCSQAFYFEAPQDTSVFYSPRKFFGLPDGGQLYTPFRLGETLPTDTALDHFEHLLIRHEQGAEAGYAAFRQDDELLSGRPLMHMSPLTGKLMDGIDYDAIRTKRLENYRRLEAALGATNKLQLDASSAPLVYPYFTDDENLRQRLIDEKIFAATYWPYVLQSNEPASQAHRLAAGIIPLPIDQRYTLTDMDRILKVMGEV